jgi:hypothetical protein
VRAWHRPRRDRVLARDPTPEARLGRSVAGFNAFTVHASEYSAPQPCTVVGLQPTVMHFSAAAMLFDHGWVTSPIDDSRGPTDKQIGRKLAALREVMGFDVETLAARSRLDVNLILAIEAGTCTRPTLTNSPTSCLRSASPSRRSPVTAIPEVTSPRSASWPDSTPVWCTSRLQSSSRLGGTEPAPSRCRTTRPELTRHRDPKERGWKDRGDVDDRPFNGRALLVDHHTRELLLLCRQLELEGIAKPPARHPWAWLLQRVFAVDIMTCPRCRGAMRLVKIANTPDDIARVLADLGLGARPPPRPRPAPTRQLELDFAA